MKPKYLCRTCKKPHKKKANGFYCDKCEKLWKTCGATRYQVGEKTWVWVRQFRVVRAVDKGKEFTPIREWREIVE